MVVGRKRRRLDDIDVGAADVFLDFDENLHVREPANHGFGRRQMQPTGDFLGQRGIGIAGDQLDRAIFGRHQRFSSRLAGYDVQHIEKSSEPALSMGEEISGRWLGWQPVGAVFPVKKRQIRDFYGGAYWAL